MQIMTENYNHQGDTEQPKSAAEIASRFAGALRQYQQTKKQESEATGATEPQIKPLTVHDLYPQVPKRVRMHILATHDQAIKGAKRIHESQPILVLSGPNRTGKSTLAASIAAAYGKKFVWKTAAEMLDEIKASWESKRPWKKPSCSLLVIDEVEKIVSSDWAINTIDNTITGRYDDCLPTIVTTNLDADGFRGQMSARLVSRVKEQQSFHQCNKPWWI